MVFIYKTQTGEYILSERPYGQIKSLGWEMLECHKTLDAAKKRADRFFKQYTFDTVPRDRYIIKPRKNRTQKTKRQRVRMGKLVQWKIPTYQINYPWYKYRSRAKYASSMHRYWQKKPDMYFVIRPDGKAARVWLPEGKEHAILPEGWRFGRPKGDSGLYKWVAAQKALKEQKDAT